MLLSLMIMSLLIAILPLNQIQAATPSTLKIGSKNGDVWDLQYRLNQLNYPVKIDGVYGYESYNAVMA